MKLPDLFSACCMALILALPAASAIAAPDKKAAAPKTEPTVVFPAGETVGGLALEAPAASVLKKFGDPPVIGDNVLMEATGEWVQEWSWPKLGLEINMGSTAKNGPKTVWSITAGKGSDLVTKRGIKIGSTMEEVRKAYGDVEDKESPASKDSFVAGSVYGGLIFTLNKGKVTQIFLGAAAE